MLTYRKIIITNGLGNAVLGLLDHFRVFFNVEGTNGVIIFLSEQYLMEEKESLEYVHFLDSITHFNSHCISLTAMP